MTHRSSLRNLCCYSSLWATNPSIRKSPRNFRTRSMFPNSHLDTVRRSAAHLSVGDLIVRALRGFAQFQWTKGANSQGAESTMILLRRSRSILIIAAATSPSTAGWDASSTLGSILLQLPLLRYQSFSFSSLRDLRSFSTVATLSGLRMQISTALNLVSAIGLSQHGQVSGHHVVLAFLVLITPSTIEPDAS
jgi:hypothetical protein